METNSLIKKLQEDFPQFAFMKADQSYWSPKTGQIYYDNKSGNQTGAWGLLHELGHATLNHSSYTTDIDLLQKEVAAWSQASSIAKDYGILIEDSYVQGCLETYRNWLYKRSTCPECGAHGAQNTSQQYCCLNCETEWSVSTSRFCRPYRGKNSKKSQDNNSWLFVENFSQAVD